MYADPIPRHSARKQSLPPDGRSRALTVPGGPNDLLANPAVVAASAIPGRLMEPESMRRAVRRDTRVR